MEEERIVVMVWPIVASTQQTLVQTVLLEEEVAEVRLSIFQPQVNTLKGQVYLHQVIL